MNNEILSKFKTIKALIFDVDGVLTDGRVLVTERGEQWRSMSIKDGYALKAAVEKGLKVAIITGGTSEGVAKRLKGLGVDEIHLGVHDKLRVCTQVLEKFALKSQDVLYMGDDIPDLEVMKRAGVAACPSNAAPEILEQSHFISSHPGGEGCVREVIEKVMKLQQLWV